MRRLLLDQGLARSTAATLTAQGWDVLHVADIGLARATDLQIVERATHEKRVCVTLDADFHALVATSGNAEPSVVRIRKEGLDGRAMAALLSSIWPGIEQALTSGALVTVSERSVRVRVLPISRS